MMRPLKKGMSVSFKETTGYELVSLVASTSASITAGAIVGALCPPAGVALSVVYGIGSGVLGSYVGDKAGRQYAETLAGTIDSIKTASTN